MTGQQPDNPESDLEARLNRLERAAAGRAGSRALDRLLRYVPLLAVGNLLVSGPAILISVGVAYFTFIQAEATRKMQIAGVWPHVTAGSGNRSPDGAALMSVSLANQGVGPALVRGMEVRYRGTAYPGPHDLLRACCVDGGGAIKLVTSPANGEVLRPGDESVLFAFAPDDVPPGAFERFDQARHGLRIRVCYCSVFDDCWVSDRSGLDPAPVDQCPTDWLQYGFPQSAPARR
jgi:hypothetical protein